VKEVLQTLVTLVLTNPSMKKHRERFGTAEDMTVALVDGAELAWPKEFKPQTHGYRLVPAQPDPPMTHRRILGIRLDRFELRETVADIGRIAPIRICIVNAGGTANGDTGDPPGEYVYATPTRVNFRWTLK
jgi:hypothetical protein